MKNVFLNSFLQNSAASSCSSQSSKLSGMFLSMYDEYLVRTEFNNIAEVNLNQVKSIVIVGTIRMIPQDVPWYYIACNRKVYKKSDNAKRDVAVLVDEDEVYECKTESCNNTVIQYLQSFKIPLDVQDSTGTLSLTLFDRDACKLLKTTASELIKKTGVENGILPDEFRALLGKKFAFKIDISQYNLDNHKWVFGVSKLTDDKDIIYELEKKENIVEVFK
ncbi:uncharacterized protein LOC143570268 [Bidens hawaiensis]|uniref:uncharacterized protein LOC143570268 n=1 Tax=Bidens hawaiensis TaxID=980011 RepID=UPI004049BB4B